MSESKGSQHVEESVEDPVVNILQACLRLLRYLKTKPWFKPLRRLAILVLFFLTGILVYTSYEGWSVGTAVAFIAVTITTVGYGYHTPSTDGTRFFTVFYMLFGIYFVYSFISDGMMPPLQTAGKALKKSSSASSSRSRDVGAAYLHNFRLMCFNVLAIVVCVMLGALVLKSMEDWSFISALYFAVQTSTTVGYGDLDIRHGYTHLFLAFYMIFSTVLFAFAFNNLQMLRAKRKQMHKLEAMIQKRKDLRFLLDMDTGDGVTEDQFILALLLHFGNVEYQADVQPWVERFAALDKHRRGRVYKEDLVTFTAQESHEADDEYEQLETSRTMHPALRNISFADQWFEASSEPGSVSEPGTPYFTSFSMMSGSSGSRNVNPLHSMPKDRAAAAASASPSAAV